MVLIFLVLVALQNGKGMGVVNKVNNFFIPIIMCVLVIVAILTIKTNTSLTGNLLTSLGGLNSAVSYVGINILLAGSMLIYEGKNYTKNNIKSASFLSAFVLFLIILLFNIALSNNSFTSSMPMVKLSFSINYYVGLLTLICVLFAIYFAWNFSYVAFFGEQPTHSLSQLRIAAGRSRKIMNSTLKLAVNEIRAKFIKNFHHAA